MQERLIPIDEAVAPLQPQLKVPVVLPRDRLAGVPNLKGWRADPRYLEWGREFGVRHGSLQLVKDGKVLIISFGLVTFDGCGGTDFAIPTQVAGQPAFLSVSREGLWSQILWPMGVGDTTASHGLAGNFEG